MAVYNKSDFADRKMVGRAVKDSFVKLNPRIQAKNPVMLLVFISAVLTTGLWLAALFGLKDAPAGYTLAIAVILWFTVLFANFAEAIAEGRGLETGCYRPSHTLGRPKGTGERGELRRIEKG